MKKIILLLLVFVLVLGGAGCANNGDNEKNDTNVTAELALLQKNISDAGKLIGVAYLGWLEGDMETACADLATLDYTKDFPFIKDTDKRAEAEGYRMYLIVPVDDSVSVSVCKCEFDDEYMPHSGEELISANEPILVRGNVSDTIPNLCVIATKGSEKVEYTPVQSGMDGRLENSENLVYDLTPYDRMPEFSAFDRVPDMVFCGDWLCVANDGNSEERTLCLTLEPDGSVKYAYGIGNSEVLERFEGTWSEEDDILELKLVGGQPESLENPVVTAPYDCNPRFEWEVTAGGLSLKHVGGDEILYGTRGITFDFYAADN